MYPVGVAVLLAVVMGMLGGCRGAGGWPAAPAPSPERDAHGPGDGGAGGSGELAAVRSKVRDGQLALREAASGAAIISPSGWPLWRHVVDPAGTLRPEVEVRDVPGGVDVVYTFRNTGDRAMRLGQFSVGGIELGGAVERARIDLDGQMVAVDPEDAHRPLDRVYPGHAYAPVAVLRGRGYAVGVSLNYDVLRHRHLTTVSTFAPGGRFGDGWRVTFAPNVFGHHRDEGDIQPGETRRYTMSVRVMKGARGDDWVRTLEPYRDFFRSVHGGVDYQRDPRPVYATALAQSSAVSASNPRGWAYASTRDPERFGWGPWVEHLEQVASRGFERFLIVAPTGVFKAHPEQNFPFQFTSAWGGMSQAQATLGLLGAFARRHELGLWWGRSTGVMDTWDDGQIEPFDPRNPRHVRRVVEELDGAVEAGATTIGLDAFSNVDPWAGWAFLDIAQQTHPGVKFVVEPMASDLFHNRAASYLWATRVESQAGRQAMGRHVLADYLNPGHETWARVDARAVQSIEGLTRGREVPEAAVEAWVRRAAEWGYVPVVHFALDVTDAHRAAGGQ